MKFKIAYKMKNDQAYHETTEVEAASAWDATQVIMKQARIPARWVVKVEVIR